MIQFCLEYIWLVPVLSLIAFLVIAIGDLFVVYRNNIFSMYITVLSSLLGLVISGAAFCGVYGEENFAVDKSFSWLMVDSLSVDLGWMVDHLSLMMLVMVCFVSLCVQIFSNSYMKKDSGYSRFFGYLALFNFSMCSFVLSPNLFQGYIFWELVGVCSYLLIGFWFKKQSSAKAAFKAFMVNRIGDFAFLLALIAFGAFTFNYWIGSNGSFLSFADINMAVFYLHNVIGLHSVEVVGVLFLIAACAKSAQVPLHIWLPDAMEAPTPVSALIHSATMVVAGVFLIARLYPVYMESGLLMNLLAFVGITTAFLCALFAVFETDLKKILAYSTCSQLGYMFLALGISAYSSGLFHMFCHSFSKALLFLSAGCIIFSLGGRQNIFLMGGMRKKIPFVAYSFLIGVISLSGLCFSGFFSKDEILHSVLASENIVLTALFVIVGIITSFYLFRVYFVVFEGECEAKDLVTKPVPFDMGISLAALSLLSVFFGFLFSGHFNIEHFDDLVYYSYLEAPSFSLKTAFVSVVISLAGICLAYGFYVYKKGLFDAGLWKEKFFAIWFILKKGMFFDFAAERIVGGIFCFFSRLIMIVDKFLIDGFVRLSSKLFLTTGKIVRYCHFMDAGGYVVLSIGWLIVLCAFLYVFKVLFV